MKWTKLTVDTTVEAVDLIASFMEDLGIEGVMIEDHVPLTEEEKRAMYVDIPLVDGVDDGSSKVSCFLDESFDVDQIRKDVGEELVRLSEFLSVGTGEITVSITEDKDWMNNWKEFFHPFAVSEDIWVKPPWEKLPAEAGSAKVVTIDPGVAFGTGTHETTKLCIGALKKYMKEGDTVFDVGAGSGILSMVAVLLGAGFVHGMDIDEAAVRSAMDNAKLNDMSEEKLRFTCGNLLAGSPLADNSYSLDSKKIEARNETEKADDVMKQALSLNGGKVYDVVVANILADVIIPLTKVVPACLKEGGYFITSGIVAERAEDVSAAMQAQGFTTIEIIPMGEWVSVVGQQRFRNS